MAKNAAAKKDNEPEAVPGGDERAEIKRKRLVARVAGSIAAGIVTTTTKATNSAAAIAEVSVDIAEEILQKVGL